MTFKKSFRATQVFDSKRSGQFLQNDFFKKGLKATEIFHTQKGRVNFYKITFFKKALRRRKFLKGRVNFYNMTFFCRLPFMLPLPITVPPGALRPHRPLPQYATDNEITCLSDCQVIWALSTMALHLCCYRAISFPKNPPSHFISV